VLIFEVLANIYLFLNPRVEGINAVRDSAVIFFVPFNLFTKDTNRLRS